jgi:hypothetical protein
MLIIIRRHAPRQKKIWGRHWRISHIQCCIITKIRQRRLDAINVTDLVIDDSQT